MRAIKSTQKITIGTAVVIGLCFLASAGAAYAEKVTVDFDKDTDFSKYKTYTFATGTPTPETLTNQRIEKALETALAAKGLARVSSNADLTVLFHCAHTTKTQLNTTSLGSWGWGPGWGGLGGDAITQVEEIPVGTLIVDIGDSANNRYVWRGTATKTLSGNPEKNAKTIDQDVKKMFEKFPPKEEK
jgi:Domain of unknown function (DUF4136)